MQEYFIGCVNVEINLRKYVNMFYNVSFGGKTTIKLLWNFQNPSFQKLYENTTLFDMPCLKLLDNPLLI